MSQKKVTLQTLADLEKGIVRVTEQAALAASKFVGSGDKNGGDGAAVDAMRAELNQLEMFATIIIGEGEKDEAPMLFNGEVLGTKSGQEIDIAVDPVEGTNLMATGRNNSISVIAFAPAGSMWNPGSSLYMDKIVVEKAAKTVVDIRLSVTENLNRIAKALGRPVSSLNVFILDKPRHKKLIKEIESAGGNVKLHSDGDVMGAILAATPSSGIDVLMGIGGTPEGVLSAVAVKALDGGMIGRRAPQKDYEKAALLSAGVNLSEILDLKTLINAEEALFSATAITDCPILKGVIADDKLIQTETLLVNAKSNSLRKLTTIHK